MTGVFLISFVVGVASLISYREKKDKATRFALGILLIYVTLSPLPALFEELDEAPSFDISVPDGYDESYKTVARDAFEEGIGKAIADRFSLLRENVTVIAEGFDFANMRAEKIRVILSGRAALADYSSIERYVNEFDIGECEAEIEIG